MDADTLPIMIGSILVYFILGGIISEVTWNYFRKRNYRKGDLLPHEAALGVTQGILALIWPVMLFFSQRIWKYFTGK